MSYYYQQYPILYGYFFFPQCFVSTLHAFVSLKINITGKPSKVQVNCGGGLPVATHFNETVGPGWRVCSENQYSSSGDASNLQFLNEILIRLENDDDNNDNDIYSLFNDLKFYSPPN